MSRASLVSLVGLLIAGVAGQWVLDAFGNRATDFWTGAIVHGVATIPYIILCRAAVAGRYRPGFVHAFALVVLLRLLALPLQPALSDDVYRYMHEGTMVLEGHNPYVTAPAGAPPDQRHPEYWKLINNKDVPAAYPPAVQFALVAGVTISPTPLGMKIFFGVCDLLIFVVLWLWLPRIGSKPRLAIVHGFCPLMVLEFAGEGHSDSLAVLFVLLCLFAYAHGRRHVSGAMLAIATAGKLLPLVLLPFVARKKWWVLLPFCVVLSILYARFVWGLAIGDWPGIFHGTVRYADAWRANDSVFYIFHLGSEIVLEWLKSAGVQTDLEFYPHRLAKVPIVLFGSLLLILAWVRQWPIQKVAAALFMVFVSFTPTMHPWYLAFLVPFLCIYPSTLWLVFTGSIYLAYHVRPDWIAMQQVVAPGVREHVAEVVEDLGIKIVEYVPFYLGFIGVLLDTRSGAATDRQSTKR